ncbi:MAG: ABC-type sulfate transport system permease subunit [Psychroserpens sp.]|jgi:ABC-type sulfate transport system permease subunit|uniref:hypothetical protein n=1 Tax=Psychroserpens sp. TaxID=2020870 RepID=UPI0039E5A6B8
MKLKRIIMNSIAVLMVVVLLTIPLSNINKHTYTTGVSNDHRSYDCINDDYFSSGYELIEL